jgi:NAD(P)H dehydrogenase (quinone)
MTKVLVLYYSAYGHIATMAAAVAEGARQAGAAVSIKRVPELMDEAAAREAGLRPDDTPIASVGELGDYDAIIFGTPTRFGNMASQMKNFLDRCGGLWARNALIGRVGSAFTSSESQHGGQEHTLLSMHASLMHLGMVVVGLPYSFKGQTRMDEITGGSPYGATTLAVTDDGKYRQPSVNELDGARFQGRHVAEIAASLSRARLAARRADPVELA